MTGVQRGSQLVDFCDFTTLEGETSAQWTKTRPPVRVLGHPVYSETRVVASQTGDLPSNQTDESLPNSFCLGAVSRWNGRINSIGQAQEANLRQRTENQHPVPATQHSRNLSRIPLGQRFNVHREMIINALFGSGYAGLGMRSVDSSRPLQEVGSRVLPWMSLAQSWSSADRSLQLKIEELCGRESTLGASRRENKIMSHRLPCWLRTRLPTTDSSLCHD